MKGRTFFGGGGNTSIFTTSTFIYYIYYLFLSVHKKKTLGCHVANWMPEAGKYENWFDTIFAPSVRKGRVLVF